MQKTTGSDKTSCTHPCLCIQDFGNGLLGIISDMEIIKIGTVKNSAIFILRHKS
jgi:hypothetical protein